MIELISLGLFLVVFIALAYSVVTDLKERIVPNWLSYGLITIGIITNATISFLSLDYSFLTNSIISGTIAFLFAYILYKIGVWAGGDVKLLTGVGFSLPFNPAYSALNGLPIVFEALNLPVFFLHVFVASVLSVLPLTIVVLFVKFLKKPKLQKKINYEFKTGLVSSTIPLALFFPFLLYALKFLTIQFPISLIVSIVTVLILYKLDKKLRLMIVAVFFVISLFLSINESSLIFISSIFFLSLVSVALILLKHSNELFSKKIPFSKLEEGMICAETIIEENGEIVRRKGINIRKIITFYMNLKADKATAYIKQEGNAICSPTRAAGLTDEDIAKLKQLASNGKIEAHLLIKQSLPFAPFLLSGFILTVIVGDFLWLILA